MYKPSIQNMNHAVKYNTAEWRQESSKYQSKTSSYKHYKIMLLQPIHDDYCNCGQNRHAIQTYWWM